jgi:hypothetical protein
MLVINSLLALATVPDPELKSAVSPDAGTAFGLQLLGPVAPQSVLLPPPTHVSVAAWALPAIARARAGTRHKECRRERKARAVEAAVEGDSLWFIELIEVVTDAIIALKHEHCNKIMQIFVQ